MPNSISKYAPIVIPTLCRYNCFIPCVESLEKCIGAEYTEVYVALDFPLNDSHKEGYEKICNYLESRNFKFKALHFIKREHNYGVSGKDSNVNVILRELWQQYDRLILSEDDNVFSSNFLQFINKGLDIFEDDHTVDSICGYLDYYGIKTDGNTFYRCPNYFSAWGYATWKSRTEERKKITTKYFRRSLSFRNLIKMAKLGRSRFLAYLGAICPTNYLWINDVNLGTYMILEGKCQIRPSISLVKNIGVDSGENFSSCAGEIANLYLKQPVSTDTTFEFVGTGYEFQEENVKHCVHQEKLFHEKYHWITRKVVVKLTLKRVMKIILGCFGWKPKN